MTDTHKENKYLKLSTSPERSGRNGYNPEKNRREAMRQMLENGPEPQDTLNAVTEIVNLTDSPFLKENRERERETGLAGAEARFVTDVFRDGVKHSKEMAAYLIQGGSYDWWDIEKYRIRMQPVYDVTSDGQFVTVLGKYALNRVGGQGPIMVANHSEVFPNADGKFIDALTNATVTNMGQEFPPHVVAATTMTRISGGAQCIPYHPGPLMEHAATALIDLAPIEKKGSRVAWFNSGGDAVSVAITAAEQYTKKVHGENGVRVAAFFEQAYHGNIEGRAGRTTSGINQTYHENDRNSVELPYPDKAEDVEPLRDRLLELAENKKLSAILFEATQGDGGGVSMHPDAFNEIVRISIDYGIPLVCDEVQSGFGRSGKIFDVEYLLEQWKNSPSSKGYPEKPPMILAVAKSLTNGAVPGSAVVLPEEYAVLGRAQGLNTYSAHPGTLASAIVSARLMTPELLQMVNDKREVFDEAIAQYVDPDGFIKKVRGHGLHLFLDVKDNQLLQTELLGHKRVLTGTVARNGLRVHLPINAPDIVWQATAEAIGQVSKELQEGKISEETKQILRGGPSGLAVR